MKKLLTLWKNYSFIVLFAVIILSLFDFRIAIAVVVCMIAPVIVAIFKGRFWCGNLCPRGSFYDCVVIKFSKQRKVPKFLKSTIFRAFIVAFIMTMFGIGLKQNWGNTYGIGMVFYRIIVITTIVGVILSFFFNHRTWCNFCPMGTIAALVAKARKSNKVLQIAPMCVSCKICEKKCPLGIVPYDYKGNYLSHPDCIQCGMCVRACPKKAIGYDVIKNN